MVQQEALFHADTRWHIGKIGGDVLAFARYAELNRRVTTKQRRVKQNLTLTLAHLALWDLIISAICCENLQIVVRDTSRYKKTFTEFPTYLKT